LVDVDNAAHEPLQTLFMSFFDDPPPEPPTRPRPLEPVSVPPWSGPGHGVAAGVLALELLLAQTDRLAVYLPDLLIYPTGLSLQLQLLGRRSPRPGIESGPGTWRFGVQFSDGSKATQLRAGVGRALPHPRDRGRRPQRHG